MASKVAADNVKESQRDDVTAMIERLTVSASLPELMEALETLLVYTRNLIQFPDEKKYRKVKTSNQHYLERLGHLPGGQEAMATLGYVHNGEFLRLDERTIKDEDNATRLRYMEKRLNEQLNKAKREFGQPPYKVAATHSWQAVHSVACHSDMGKRHNMEDDEMLIDRFGGHDKTAFFGLYDGHGGRATVDYVVKALHMNLQQEFKRKPDITWALAFKNAYLTTDGQLRRSNILRSGSTAVTCVVTWHPSGTAAIAASRTSAVPASPSTIASAKPFSPAAAAAPTTSTSTAGSKRMLYCANVGDSRAVLCRGDKAIRLTIDHKASLPEEAKRIVDAGGFVSSTKRVNGVLAISRALGDHLLKENDVVTAEPYTQDIELTHDDHYLILACDGLWDVMTDQDACDFVLAKVKANTETEGKSRADEAKTLAATESSASSSSSSTSNTTSLPLAATDLLRTIAKSLVKEALDRRSQDNVTCCIVRL